MLDDATRIDIAKSLEDLAAQDVWNPDAWQRCYDLVAGNMNHDELYGYVHDDLIHYTGKSPLRSAPRPKDFGPGCRWPTTGTSTSDPQLNILSGAKARTFMALDGATEAAPFQSQFGERLPVS